MNLEMLLGIAALIGKELISLPPLEPKQKIKLGDAAPVSAEFRAEFDAWLLEMFGTEQPWVYRTEKGIFVPPSIYKSITGAANG